MINHFPLKKNIAGICFVFKSYNNAMYQTSKKIIPELKEGVKF